MRGVPLDNGAVESYALTVRRGDGSLVVFVPYHRPVVTFCQYDLNGLVNVCSEVDVLVGTDWNDKNPSWSSDISNVTTNIRNVTTPDF